MYYLHSLSAGRMNKLMMVEVYYCPGNQAYFEVYYLHSLSAGRMNKLMMVEVYYCPGNQAYFEVL